MRFLVVDDDPQTRLLMQRLLGEYGSVDIAADGEESILAFSTALKDKKPYTLIAMDILMPNMDGQEALREIREIERERNIPQEEQTSIVIISGLENSEEVHNAYSLGSTVGYIEKPISKENLLSTIIELGIQLPKK